MSGLSVVPSWSAGLCRTGGYYQDSEWYNHNIARSISISYNNHKFSLLYDIGGCHWSLKWFENLSSLSLPLERLGFWTYFVGNLIFFSIKCFFLNISWQWSVQCGRQKGLSEVSADHSGQKSVQIGAMQTTVRGSGHQLYSGIRIQYWGLPVVQKCCVSTFNF